jgi:hypothetical protein
LSNISNLILVAANIRIKVYKWNFIKDNLGEGQFICRETCCFVHWGQEKYFAAKRKMAGAIIAWRSHLFLSLF